MEGTTYTVSFGKKLQEEFQRFPKDQQDKIIAFADLYERVGLVDFDLYEGKIAPSWSGLDESNPLHGYCRENFLWHYHIGIPEYHQRHEKYKTSEWVLHFMWPHQSSHIVLVDIYSHYVRGGEFYLPPEDYLLEA